MLPSVRTNQPGLPNGEICRCPQGAIQAITALPASNDRHRNAGKIKKDCCSNKLQLNMLPTRLHAPVHICLS